MYSHQNERQRIAALEAKNGVSQALKDSLQKWEYNAGTQKSIRTLLSSMHLVLWPNHGWTPLGIGDVQDEKKIHKWINKARLIIHPDKQPQDASPERRYIAERVNEAINTAWAAFGKNGGR
jgi:hypothetical protein